MGASYNAGGPDGRKLGRNQQRPSLFPVLAPTLARKSKSLLHMCRKCEWRQRPSPLPAVLSGAHFHRIHSPLRTQANLHRRAQCESPSTEKYSNSVLGVSTFALDLSLSLLCFASRATRASKRQYIETDSTGPSQVSLTHTHSLSLSRCLCLILCLGLPSALWLAVGAEVKEQDKRQSLLAGSLAS